MVGNFQIFIDNGLKTSTGKYLSPNMETKMLTYQFTSSESNPPFAVMRKDSYADYCFDCSCEGIDPIDWGTWKRLVGELLADGAGDAWACMYAQKLAFQRFHSN